MGMRDRQLSELVAVKAFAPLMSNCASSTLSLAHEREAWLIYSSTHILSIGGVPASNDMRIFAPQLWRHETSTPAIYFVFNDGEMDTDGYDYIKQTQSLGWFQRVHEPTQSPPGETGGASEAEEEMCEAVLKAERWSDAKAKLALRGRETFDTSGLSAHGIVPRLY